MMKSLMYLNGSCRQNDAKEEEMRHVEQIVAGAGWLDKSPDGINEIDLEGITPTIDNSASQWSSLQLFEGSLRLLEIFSYIRVIWT